MKQISPARHFTLIELMITVGLMAMAFALILPLAEGSTPTYRLRAAARQVGGAIEVTHSEAVASRRPFAVVYDFNNNTIFTIVPVERPIEGQDDKTQWVLDENDPESYTPPEELPKNVVLESVQTAEGEAFQGGQRIIRFDPGSTRGSHIVTITVRDPEGLVTLQPWSIKYNTMTRSLTYREGSLTFFRE